MSHWLFFLHLIEAKSCGFAKFATPTGKRIVLHLTNTAAKLLSKCIVGLLHIWWSGKPIVLRLVSFVLSPRKCRIFARLYWCGCVATQMKVKYRLLLQMCLWAKLGNFLSIDNVIDNPTLKCKTKYFVIFLHESRRPQEETLQSFTDHRCLTIFNFIPLFNELPFLSYIILLGRIPKTFNHMSVIKLKGLLPLLLCQCACVRSCACLYVQGYC